MCVAFVAKNVSPAYPLVIAANRDEFLARPTRVAEFWPETSAGVAGQMLAGQDLEAGGTWLGVTRGGRWAVVTNFRVLGLPGLDHLRSRGSLVTDYLQSSESAATWVGALSSRISEYRPFNLVVGEGAQTAYFLGYRNADPMAWPTGVTGVSNGALGPDLHPWPKVAEGERRLARLIRGPFQADAIFDLLAAESVARDEELPDTGVGLARERALSALFVRLPGYGTRSSTVITLDAHGKFRFEERTHGAATARAIFEFPRLTSTRRA